MTNREQMNVAGRVYDGYGVVEKYPLFYRLSRTIPRECWPKIPARVREGALRPEVDIHSDALTMVCGKNASGKRHSSVDWIFASQSWPHQDESYEGTLFTTLVLESSHVIGFDYGGSIEDVQVDAGDIVVFDPMVIHWLRPLVYEDGLMRPWYGIQWVTAVEKWKTYFHIILKEMLELRELQSSAEAQNEL